MDIHDEDHVLVEGAGWIEVNGFAIRIRSTSTGIAIAVYESGREMDDALHSIDLELPWNGLSKINTVS